MPMKVLRKVEVQGRACACMHVYVCVCERERQRHQTSIVVCLLTWCIIHGGATVAFPAAQCRDAEHNTPWLYLAECPPPTPSHPPPMHTHTQSRTAERDAAFLKCFWQLQLYLITQGYVDVDELGILERF